MKSPTTASDNDPPGIHCENGSSDGIQKVTLRVVVHPDHLLAATTAVTTAPRIAPIIPPKTPKSHRKTRPPTAATRTMAPTGPSYICIFSGIATSFPVDGQPFFFARFRLVRIARFFSRSFASSLSTASFGTATTARNNRSKFSNGLGSVDDAFSSNRTDIHFPNRVQQAASDQRQTASPLAVRDGAF